MNFHRVHEFHPFSIIEASVFSNIRSMVAICIEKRNPIVSSNRIPLFNQLDAIEKHRKHSCHSWNGFSLNLELEKYNENIQEPQRREYIMSIMSSGE